MTRIQRVLLGAVPALAACGVFAVMRVFAAPPGSVYTPGETLAPTCAPGDSNCTVTAPMATVAPGDSGNVLTSNGTSWTSAAPAGGGDGNAWTAVVDHGGSDTVLTGSDIGKLHVFTVSSGAVSATLPASNPSNAGKVIGLLKIMAVSTTFTMNLSGGDTLLSLSGMTACSTQFAEFPANFYVRYTDLGDGRWACG